MDLNEKQDILRAISDLDERLTRALTNMGYDANGVRLEAEKISESIKNRVVQNEQITADNGQAQQDLLELLIATEVLV